MGKEIGIDLGTTNTVVSYINKKGRLRSLKFEGSDVIPSVLYFRTENDFMIGEKARKKGMLNPQAQVADFKSHLGDAEKLAICPEEGEPFRYHAKRVASDFLSRIADPVEKQLIREFGPEEGCIDSVVITVPAKFNSVEKAATKWAAQDAGFENVRLAAEPTAAAVAHRYESGIDGQTVLVYDFGGGTFDVSVIRKAQSCYEEVATGGDKRLGGNLLRGRLAKYLLGLINDDYGLELPLDPEEFDEDVCGITLLEYQRNIAAILDEADRIKESLSEEETEEASVNLLLPERKAVLWSAGITREKFESLIEADVQRTVDITRSVIEEAHARGIESIDQIVLAGGSSQIPAVKERLEKAFGQTIFADDISTLIARGAALLASEELAGATEQITNVQYGVAANSGVALRQFRCIIPEDRKLPCSGKEYFYLNKDGQRRLEIPYYERDIKNYPKATRTDDEGITQIDTLILSDLPEGLRKDEVKISVEFFLQEDGTLEVKADIMDMSGNSIRNGNVICKRSSNLE